MSSGQVYFNYNEAAFGMNVFENGRAAVSLVGDDYLLDLKDNYLGVANVYSTPLLNDNTREKLSVAWQQEFAGNCISKGITTVPTPLFHLKLKYVPNGTMHQPEICFETSDLFVHQFYTACGEMIGDCTLGSVDCLDFPGISVTDENFDCSGASFCGNFAVDAGENVEACVGSSLTIGGTPSAAGGNGNYTYSWFPTEGLSASDIANPVVTISTNKTYTLAVTDEFGCQQVSTVLVEALSLPEVNYEIQETSSATAADGGITLAITGGVAPYTITWEDGSNTMTRGNLTPGIYDATVEDAKGCSLSISIVVSTAMTTGLEPSATWIQAVTLFPNPVDESFMIDLTSVKPAPIVFQIVDELGRVLYEARNAIAQGDNRFDFQTLNLVNGDYFIQSLDEAKESVFVKPFIKVGK